MISVFVNLTGYYISGGDLEIAARCVPNIAFYTEQHCEYLVLIKALNHLRGLRLDENITVYNDTRIIDEMNGVVSPLDSLSGELCSQIRQAIIPEINGTVFFKKKNLTLISQNIDNAEESLIKSKHRFVPPPHKDNKSKIINKFKESWYGRRTS